ncbi:Sensor histidine kinase YpdA [compost metagenome]
MQHNLTILLQLFERAALLLMCLFVLTRVPRFKEIFVKEVYAPQELAMVTVVFSLFAILGTYTGINVEGSLVNVRIIAIVAGGILFGPWVGLITGIISGVHRFLIDIGGITSVPDYKRYGGDCLGRHLPTYFGGAPLDCRHPGRDGL